MSDNHLADAQSPYLRQHADNPVHWFEWGDETFDEAKKQDKPVFLSIGYATCHWCHVMAHESFEDRAVAQLMNRHFISIKVDREERPDIDNTYMTICQMLTGRGGWPLTIVMTPDKKPFYAATYLPKDSRHGQPGLMELLPRLNQLWTQKRGKLEDSAEEITRAFQQSIHPQSGQPLPDDILDDTIAKLTQQFDEVHGGFGSAPKFPVPHTLIFLLRYAHVFDDKEAVAMAEKTLTAMRQGGIFDHIGGGFHRYSTDPQWLVPHFEKMLYDQAMHLMAYTEGYQSTGNHLFKQTVEETVSYLLRDMQHTEGAFYSAEDADSEGEEGTFYVWSENEIREVLPPGDARLAIDIFNVKPKGNYKEQATDRRTGQNILHRTKSMVALAAERQMDEETLRQKIGSIRQQLFEVREKRERPFLDDKILTDWNGLVIAALAKAGRALDEKKYISEAERAATFIFENLQPKGGALLHRWRAGKSAIPGTTDDYAFFILGLLELYESTFKTAYVKKAIDLQQSFLKTHWDEDKGGFFFTADKTEELLGRKKEYFDSARPSGNSAAAMNLLRLGRITAKPEWEEKAEKIMESTAKQLEQAPTSFTQLLQAHLWITRPTREIVIAGPKKDQDTQKMIHRLHEIYLPQAVLILNDENDADIQDLQELAPYLKHQPMQDGRATVYVCQNYACEEPVHGVEEMMALLKQNS